MTNNQLIEVIRELYRLWRTQDSDEDIDFILSTVISKIGEK